jgi:hypothetical protein
MTLPPLLRFPNPVDDVSARLVAAGVVAMAAAALASRQPWLLAVLAYGFVARAVAGPRLSPLALLVTRVIRPRLPWRARDTPGPPKRFAQTMGALVTVSAVVLHYGFGLTGAAWALAGAIAVFAFLESALGLCVGCKVFALLMRLRIVPEHICVECANISARAPT